MHKTQRFLMIFVHFWSVVSTGHAILQSLWPRNLEPEGFRRPPKRTQAGRHALEGPLSENVQDHRFSYGFLYIFADMTLEGHSWPLANAITKFSFDFVLDTRFIIWISLFIPCGFSPLIDFTITWSSTSLLCEPIDTFHYSSLKTKLLHSKEMLSLVCCV